MNGVESAWKKCWSALPEWINGVATALKNRGERLATAAIEALLSLTEQPSYPDERKEAMERERQEER